MAIIECKNISKSFGEKVAIEGINLEIPEGRIFGCPRSAASTAR